MMTLAPLLLLLVGSSHMVQAADYVAEVFFVVDLETVNSYMKVGYTRSNAISTIKGDIDFLVYEINKFYKGMSSYGLNLEVRVKKLEIMTEQMFEACKLVRKTDLQADLALEVFKEWLDTNQIYKKHDYDIAMVWTGFDIFGSSGGGTAGYATTKAACNPDIAVGIAEFDGTQATAITTAHEIAHSLGSPHDNSAACNPNDGYIMTPTSTPNNKHRWEFSSCSINAINTYINGLNTKGNNCLTRSKTTTTDPNFKISSQKGRDIIDPNKVCQRTTKVKESTFCAKSFFYQNQIVKGDLVCQYLYCSSGKDDGSCSSGMPSEGMVCDIGKRCNKGRCETAASDFKTPSNLIKDCIYGDAGTLNFQGQAPITCGDYIKQKGDAGCYNHDDTCCATCAAKKQNIAGCEYGDKNSVCSQYQPNQICGSSSAICCYTCRNWNGKRSVDFPEVVIEEEDVDVENLKIEEKDEKVVLINAA